MLKRTLLISIAFAPLIFLTVADAQVINNGVTGVGTGPVTIVGILTTQSGRVRNLRRITAAGAVTVTTADDIICIAKTSGAATAVNLPATPTSGQTFVIKDCKYDAETNNITVTPNSGNIDNTSTYIIRINGGSVTISYDGTQWVVL